jgi:carboxypeptidase D
VAAIGGEESKYNTSNIPAGPEIYLGSASTQSTYIAPSATIAAWESFYATVAPIQTGTELNNGSNGSKHVVGNWNVFAAILVGILAVL